MYTGHGQIDEYCEVRFVEGVPWSPQGIIHDVGAGNNVLTISKEAGAEYNTLPIANARYRIVDRGGHSNGFDLTWAPRTASFPVSISASRCRTLRPSRCRQAKACPLRRA